MDFASQALLIGGGLLIIAILAGLLASRVGAPLLLIFLGLGMLFGVDSPLGAGIQFRDFDAAFLVASAALAIILFDGGFRTGIGSLRQAWAPAGLLATVGVALTAGIVGTGVALAFDLPPLRALLMGAIIASTDAAAVFLLLHQQGMELRRRVSTTLEVESGCNDPMAIFLTLLLVEVLAADAGLSWAALGLFVHQFGTGFVAGLAGGLVLSAVVNRLELAPGLYPVFTVACALTLFAGTQLIGASGFLAVYVAGIVCGNRRLRARALIGRFHDGMAWISQIVMFLMLGLLVTPSELVVDIPFAAVVAGLLIFVGRPLAVWLCLLPFNYTREEILFIAWVGLRGAVPIYLAIIPLVGGVPDAEPFFHVAFMVVLASLVLQGWTIPLLADRLELEMTPSPEPRGKLDIGLPDNADQDIVGYRIQTRSAANGRQLAELDWPRGARALAVLRAGAVTAPEDVDRLSAGDYLLATCPPESTIVLDRQFLAPTRRPGLSAQMALGDFAFPASVKLSTLAQEYDLRVPSAERGMTAGKFLARHLRTRPAVGDHMALGNADLVVRRLENDATIAEVGLRVRPARVVLLPGQSLTRLTSAVISRYQRWRAPPGRSG